MPQRERFEFTFKTAAGEPGRKIMLVEPGMEDQLAALRLTSQIADSRERSVEIGLEVLRRCLVSIDGKEMKRDDLEGGKLWAPFSPREFELVQRAFMKLGAPTKEDEEGFFSTMRLA